MIPEKKREELDALARALGLNARQKLFADIYTGDPSRNGTRAYQMAGYKTVGKTTATVCASRLLANAKMAAYVAALNSAISEQALAELEKREVKIAPLSEVLEICSNGLRATPGDFLNNEGRLDIEKVRKAPRGALISFDADKSRIRVAPPVYAEKLLHYYGYGERNAPQTNFQVWIKVLQSKDEEARPIALEILGREKAIDIGGEERA